MSFIPKDKIGIKADPFHYLKNYFLKLWIQKEKLLPLCALVFAVKLCGFAARSLFIFNLVKNPKDILEISATYPIPFLAIAKMGFLFIYRKKVRFLFETVTREFWDLSVGGSDLKAYWQKRFLFINFILLGHFLASCGYVVLHLMFPYVPIPKGRKRWLPTLITVPFNTDTSPVYEILYIVLSWNMFISVVGNGFFDLTFAYASQHLIAQFNILNVTLKKLENGVMEDSDDLGKFKSEKFRARIFEKIAVCVKHHTVLLRYGEELKNLTSLIFGIQLITTLVTLVLTGYTLIQHLEELAKSTMLLSFVFSSTAQFVIFAIQSADISQQSASVAVAAYQSNWYLFDAKAKRGLSLLIMNAQKGISMYGAGLVEINNEVIVKMAQKVFSFITLLRSLNEQN